MLRRFFIRRLPWAAHQIGDASRVSCGSTQGSRDPDAPSCAPEGQGHAKPAQLTAPPTSTSRTSLTPCSLPGIEWLVLGPGGQF
jgi:hypothetical protein